MYSHSNMYMKSFDHCTFLTLLMFPGVLRYADYIEPVVVVLHERELTWAGRVVWKHHTCMISALSISTTLKQPTLIWSIGVCF